MAILDLLGSKKREPAECIVSLDGEAIEELYGSLVEVTVEATRDAFTSATLIFETRRLEDGSWTVQDDERFRPWAKVRIEAAFGSVVEEVMSGFVKDVQAEYPAERGGSRVTVSCQDHSLLLDREAVETIWGEDALISDGAIVSQIVQRYGGELSQADDGGEGLQVENLPQNMTDIRFLQERARVNGYECLFREAELYFGPWRLSGDTQPSIMIYAGKDTNCISFSVKDDGHKPDQVAYQVAPETGTENAEQIVTANLPVLGTRAANEASAALGDFAWRPRREGLSTDQEMAAMAQKLANEESMKISVDGELNGSLYGHVLLVAELVGVDGAGERYSGTYYVDRVSHRFDTAGYTQTFRLLRNAYGDDLEAVGNPLAAVL
jgi:hypothetical protein